VITIPWEIIVAFIALFGLNLMLQHWRKSDCDDRIEAAKRQTQRDTMALYRETYQTGIEQGKNDA